MPSMISTPCTLTMLQQQCRWKRGKRDLQKTQKKLYKIIMQFNLLYGAESWVNDNLSIHSRLYYFIISNPLRLFYFTYNRTNVNIFLFIIATFQPFYLVAFFRCRVIPVNFLDLLWYCTLVHFFHLLSSPNFQICSSERCPFFKNVVFTIN